VENHSGIVSLHGTPMSRAANKQTRAFFVETYTHCGGQTTTQWLLWCTAISRTKQKGNYKWQNFICSSFIAKAVDCSVVSPLVFPTELSRIRNEFWWRIKSVNEI